MRSNQERAGEISILTHSLLWGLFPVITVLSYSSVAPFLSLAGSTFFSGFLFGSILTFRHKWREIKNRAALRDVIMTALIIGVGYYLFFFWGLAHTSPGNAAIIALAETLFSYLFFNIWRKEKFFFREIFGSLLMILGAVIILIPNFTHFQIGDLLILLAAFIAPLGNFFQRRARAQVSSETIMFCRAIITTPIILVISFLSGEKFGNINLIPALILLLVNGLVIMGLTKVLWIEGIHRISVTKAAALSSITPLFTLLFAWLILKELPTAWQLSSFAPIAFGIIFLNYRQVKNVSSKKLS